MGEAMGEGGGGGLDRRRAVTLMLAGLGSLVAGRVSGAEELIDVPEEFCREGEFRRMTWGCPFGPGGTFRMPVGGWPAGHPGVWLPPGPTSEVTIYNNSGSRGPYRFSASPRVVIVNERVLDPDLSDADFVVTTPPDGIDVTSEAFLRMMAHDALIEADPLEHAALFEAHLRQGGPPAPRVTRHARALCLDGVADEALVPVARAALDALGDGEFDGGLYAMALVGDGDGPAFSRDGFEAFVTGTMEGRRERVTLRMIAPEASRSAVALVAFQGEAQAAGHNS